MTDNFVDTGKQAIINKALFAAVIVLMILVIYCLNEIRAGNKELGTHTSQISDMQIGIGHLNLVVSGIDGNENSKIEDLESEVKGVNDKYENLDTELTLLKTEFSYVRDTLNR